MAKEKKRKVGRPSRSDSDLDILSGSDRREQIISVTAALFSEKGYDRTSMRDIAAATGILSGSLYYYFPSKEALFLEVHSAGMKILTSAAREVWAATDDPWERLEKLAAAHSKALLENSGFMIMVFPRFPEGIDAFRPELIRQRNEYESIIAQAIETLDLPEGIDRSLFRLQFLGALNWSQTWYSPGHGISPAQIGMHLVRMLRPLRG